MTIRIKANSFKNAIGTVFLLAAAFFVCSTLVSIRSVFADPVAPIVNAVQKNARTSPRSTQKVSKRTVSRATVASRGMAAVNNAVQNQSGNRTTVSRGTGTRKVSSRSVTPTRTTNSTSRNVASRTQKSATKTASSRAVRARSTSNASRVGTSGSVMAGARVSSNTYSYLTSKLYTGSYSNIIDSSTGLISADAYANCMDSYYTCMDEICTARSDTKGRCACAGRVTNFLEAEDQLESANEELIKLSGQLTLLIATKGKGDDLASAFSLTDAEKVMNCVSYKENVLTKKMSDSEWYNEHPTWNNNSTQQQTSGLPYYCNESNNNFGFDVSTIDGAGSDVLASLKAWADAKDLAKQYAEDKVGVLTTSVNYLSGIIDDMSGVSKQEDIDLDSLTQKWGYKLFEYAHNNVCGRVLDSCFNGIYEACGTPPTVTDSDGKIHKKCANGLTSSCPYNYNSYIKVSTEKNKKMGDVELNERGSSPTSETASCFGYSTTSTTTGTRTGTTTSDPYATLRGPVADARRSIMQKYLLDANAACDVYGAALKQTAQNINYQKIAAEQALQQKRLEFKQEADDQRFADAKTAIDNFNECISEIWDCYEEYEDEDKWTTARIKAYCSQVAQVPHCYEQMICSPLQTQLTAVIDKADSSSCAYSNDYSKNTCRNVVTINEILYGTGQAADTKLDDWDSVGEKNVSSAAVRERCLAQSLGCASNDNEGYCLRNWKKGEDHSLETLQGTCTDSQLKSKYASAGYVLYNDCIVTSCLPGYSLKKTENTCTLTTRTCTDLPAYATAGTQTWNGTGYSNCVVTSCHSSYSLDEANNKCVVTTISCRDSDLPEHATSGTKTWTGTEYGSCKATACASGYEVSNGICIEQQ